MNTIFQQAAIITLLLTGITACDVTDNNDDGSSQGNDPIVIDYPIAYIERPVPKGLADDNDVAVSILEEDVLDPTLFRGGAKLVIKDRASISATARVITDGVFPDTGETDADGNPIPARYDVRDLSVNVDGDKLAFAMRAPLDDNLDDDDPDQPTWNIWEYDVTLDTLTRVIASDIEAEKGHDRFPTYLPDDSIVFASTRQRVTTSLLLRLNAGGFQYVTERDDESYTFTLHVIDADHENIDQISYGRGHDIQPSLLEDGRILFLRSDDTSNTNDDRLSLYTMNPDGSNVSLYYGYHSPSSQEGNNTNVLGALTKPVQMPDGRILVTYQPRETNLFGGDIYTVDGENYIDVTQPTSANTGGTGPAETSISVGEVTLGAQSAHGYFNSATPLYDGTDRLLVSWMRCLVQGFAVDIYVNVVDTEIVDPDTDEILDVVTTYELINAAGEYVDRDGNLISGDPIVPIEITSDELVSLPCTTETFGNAFIEPAEPQFGIWIYDPAADTQTPIEFASAIGTLYTDAVALAPRSPLPDNVPPAVQDDFTADLAAEDVGIVHIRSIYDIDGVDVAPSGIATMANPLLTPTDSRPIRFVRFYTNAYMPHEDDLELEEDLIEGRTNNPARSIMGYAQVHPDGSVMAKIPANTSFAMEFVDANGRRVTGAQARQRHNNWLNVRPGEIRECNGCHTRTSTVPHGRQDAEPEPANPGALASAPFPNTSLNNTFGAPYDPPEVGETMAEYYVRAKLADSDVSEDPLALSVDIVFEDEWTDAATGAVVGTPIDLSFGDPDAPGGRSPDNLLTDAPVPLGKCLSAWDAECRTIINYEDHIQPIFEVARTDGNGNDITCLNCHAPADPNGNAQVPAPDQNNLQLDFTPVISPLDDDMLLLRGYDEFFANGDTLVELDENNNLVIRLVQQVINGVPQFQQTPLTDIAGTALFEYTDLSGATVCVTQAAGDADPDLTANLDANGAAIPCIRFVCTVDEVTSEEIFNDVNGNGHFDIEDSCVERVPVLVPATQNRYLSPNGANAGQNQRFFNAFEVGNGGNGFADNNHLGWLTPAELKLFSEWIDIGSQYNNDILQAVED